jgi:hypothetical protein
MYVLLNRAAQHEVMLKRRLKLTRDNKPVATSRHKFHIMSLYIRAIEITGCEENSWE